MTSTTNNDTLALLIYDPSSTFKSPLELKKSILNRYQINKHTNLLINELSKRDIEVISFLEQFTDEYVNYNNEHYYIYYDTEIIEILMKLESPETKRYYYNKYHTTYNLSGLLPANQYVIFKTDKKYIPYIYTSFVNEPEISKYYNFIIRQTYNKMRDDYMVIGFDIDRYNNNLINEFPYAMKDKMFIEIFISNLQPINIGTVLFDKFFTITNFSYSHNVNVNYGKHHKMIPYTSYNDKNIKFNVNAKLFIPRKNKFDVNVKPFISKNKKNFIQQPKK